VGKLTKGNWETLTARNEHLTMRQGRCTYSIPFVQLVNYPYFKNIVNKIVTAIKSNC